MSDNKIIKERMYRRNQVSTKVMDIVSIVRRYKNEGLSNSEISEKMGIPEFSVRHLLKGVEI